MYKMAILCWWFAEIQKDMILIVLNCFPIPCQFWLKAFLRFFRRFTQSFRPFFAKFLHLYVSTKANFPMEKVRSCQFLRFSYVWCLEVFLSTSNFQVSLLGFEGSLEWSEGSGLVAIEVQMPDRYENPKRKKLDKTLFWKLKRNYLKVWYPLYNWSIMDMELCELLIHYWMYS